MVWIVPWHGMGWVAYLDIAGAGVRADCMYPDFPVQHHHHCKHLCAPGWQLYPFKPHKDCILYLQPHHFIM